MIYYAKSTGGFYDPEIHGAAMPSDAVQITDAQHEALLAGQAAGQIITSDSGGNPVLTAPPAPTLAQVQAAQVAQLQAGCQAAITAGFTSSALGAPHQYPSQPTDQANLASDVAAAPTAPAGWTSGIWCAANGAWSLQQHTAAQLAQVNADWVAARGALQQKYANLMIKVQAATTVAAVQAITWS
ncbi:hypothetical protein [Chromobacterium subtsugae]|uniref:DUF4376 domain-containing protein n=1 Tax=Chromobacterium subtsugae TaxID=251747 RepID=UPI0009BD6803|nr:hypothetical protein [Chromobacterium subtsugae]